MKTKVFLPDAATEYLTFLLFILEVLGSNLAPETCYLKDLRGFPQSMANAGVD
jgi:hypothetical protein